MRNEGGWVRCGRASLAVRREAGAAGRTARRRGLPAARRRRSVEAARLGARGGPDPARGRSDPSAGDARSSRQSSSAMGVASLRERRIQKGREQRRRKRRGRGVAGAFAHSRTQANGSGRGRGARRRRLSSGGARALRGWGVRCTKDGAHRCLLVMVHDYPPRLRRDRSPPLQRAGNRISCSEPQPT
jgi:hypothetical protein